MKRRAGATPIALMACLLLCVVVSGWIATRGPEGGPVRSGPEARPLTMTAAPDPATASTSRRIAPGAVHFAPGVSQGEALIGELNCVACHSADEAINERLMPRQAPYLGQVGKRLTPAFLDAYLRDPQSVRPGTAMPNLFNNLDPRMLDQVVEPLVQFLVSMGGPMPLYDGDAPLDDFDVAQGRLLYHQVGCVACHTPLESSAVIRHDLFPVKTEDDPYGGDETPLDPTVPQVGYPLDALTGRTSLNALSAYLMDPVSVHPSGRMPSMNLDQNQARQIAAYLLNQGDIATFNKNAAITLDPAKVDRGRKFFAAMGCAYCHEMGPNITRIEPLERPEPITPLINLRNKIRQGCLAESVPPGAADYGLRAREREQIARVLADPGKLEFKPTAPETIGRLLTAGSCLACHVRDDAGGPSDALKGYFLTLTEADLGDEGRLPPPLTGLGGKLRPQWIRDVLEQGTKLRPYMATHMPAWRLGDGANRFVAALESVDAPCALEELAPDDFSETLRRDGRILVGIKGLACINCHSLAGHAPIGEPAVDLVNTPERLRSDWYHEYMHDPSVLRPGTRMPSFWPPGQPNPFPDIQDGDADKQIDAIWAYLSLGEFMAMPEGLNTGEGYDLVVTDRPMVFRTFIKGTGSRAIAIGFPEQVHAAFDSATCRLDQIWRGAFLSASGAWAGRGGMATDPAGEDAIKMPPGPPIATLVRPDRAWPERVAEDTPYRFKGYSLDDAGRPSFEYSYGDTAIEETLRPVVESEKPCMTRIITLKSAPSPAERLFYRAAVGKVITRSSDGSYAVDDRVTVLIEAPNSCDTSIRPTGDGGAELLVHLVGPGEVEATSGGSGPLTVSTVFKW